MIRLPLVTFSLSVALTAAAAFTCWQSRRTELEHRISKKMTPAVSETKAAPVGPPGAIFQEFCARAAACGGYVGVLDTLSGPEIEALLDDAVRMQWNPQSNRDGNPGPLLRRWMELDPDAAVAWCLPRLPGEVAKSAVSDVIGPWASAHPAAARRWFIERTGRRPSEGLSGNDTAFQREWGAIAARLSDCDPRPFHEIVKDLRGLKKEDFEIRSYMTPHGRLTQEFNAAAVSGPQLKEALELVQSLAAEESGPLARWAENEKALLLADGVSRHPLEAMQYLEAHPHNVWGDELVEIALKQLWSASRENAFATDTDNPNPVDRPSLNEVRDWFLRIPRLNKAVSALEYFVKVWPDLDQAGELLNQQPPGADVDKARARMAVRAVEVDPHSAFPWMEAITDESLRRKTGTEIQEKWRRIDPAGAAAWANSQ